MSQSPHSHEPSDYRPYPTNPNAYMTSGSTYALNQGDPDDEDMDLIHVVFVPVLPNPWDVSLN
ncbi:MAG: hypothetical protein KC476_10245 [Cyanobacteria bacterium HKST-UBA06]|nr:hypothetical protein [Cyanobacteria bacterium HKST-UBA04]MCA9808323.1 hypothetical protein [Cyanobacteria bacterium HKST-UBA06]MCA9842891.1 hypothetical protein [Cyanobacteria bacterium HKST-UBA03]